MSWKFLPGSLLLFSAVHAATLVHSYSFLNTLNDDLGGPSLVSYGGTLDSSGYTFGPDQGLSLTNAFVDTTDYSIEIHFMFSSFPGTNGFDKILDFTNLQGLAGIDPGLYASNQHLIYYLGNTSSAAVFMAGQFIDVVLTHDSSGNVVAYVNGSPVLGFLDNGTTDSAVLTTPTTPLWFFVDDYHSLQTEAAPGTVDAIRIWDGALTASEVAALSGPEPFSWVLVALGLAGVAVRRCRRRP
ncbi:MAG: LamG-like jellyroll fold domain-containing protein [Candidatus Solibacter sp.]|jgi:MYXO-CTERM domain-containing protein